MQPLQLETVDILTGTAIIFAVSMFAGGIGNYLGIRLVSDQHPSFVHALVSSILSAAVWGIVSLALNVYDVGITPFAGALVALLIWIVVLYLRYSGGIVSAVPAALLAWVISIIVLYVIAVYTTVPFEAIGIPAI
ncbi:hypothetical protein [Halococcus saccharolyticus]|uniref:Yip1 domain-containing protein n=1 Tax=Halococcus saccharolyticus DSM 5350 TaxID=1227455 RepID=M0MNT5_9EURY|nr:hypothetical protein [Halococcus saccharolyticus]EMA46100.1 hypothetical protein C449_05327 [Halococcus saccharolyticus DSM 5350]